MFNFGHFSYRSASGFDAVVESWAAGCRGWAPITATQYSSRWCICLAIPPSLPQRSHWKELDWLKPWIHNAPGYTLSHMWRTAKIQSQSLTCIPYKLQVDPFDSKTVPAVSGPLDVTAFRGSNGLSGCLCHASEHYRSPKSKSYTKKEMGEFRGRDIHFWTLHTMSDSSGWVASHWMQT